MSYPNVNGFDYSYASIELVVRGTRYYGATSINYEDGLTPGRTKGTTTIPLGSTAGEWDGSGSIEFNRQDGQAILSALGAGFGRVIFQIVVQYAEDGMPIVTDTLPAVRIQKVTHSNSQGSDPSKMTFDLFLLAPIQHGDLPIERLPDLTGANV